MLWIFSMPLDLNACNKPILQHAATLQPPWPPHRLWAVDRFQHILPEVAGSRCIFEPHIAGDDLHPNRFLIHVLQSGTTTWKITPVASWCKLVHARRPRRILQNPRVLRAARIYYRYYRWYWTWLCKSTQYYTIIYNNIRLSIYVW